VRRQACTRRLRVSIRVYTPALRCVAPSASIALKGLQRRLWRMETANTGAVYAAAAAAAAAMRIHANVAVVAQQRCRLTTSTPGTSDAATRTRNTQRCVDEEVLNVL